LKTALTGGPHLSAARERERGSGLVCEVGRCWVWAARKKEKNKLGWAGKREMGEGWSDFFFFNSFYFLFKLLLKTFSKFLNKLLTTQSIKTHAFNMMHKHLVSLN
jgi:hypothetical protein